jgi:hypothetical protein
MKKRMKGKKHHRAWGILVLLLPAVVFLLPLPIVSYPFFRILGFSLAGIALLLLLWRVPRVVKSGRELLFATYRQRLGGWLTRAALFGGILLNLSYAAFRFAVGVRSTSLWFCAEAVYYLLLCAARILLVEEERQISAETDPAMGDTLAWQAYRRGGFFMLILSLAASGIVVLALREERTRGYPDIVVAGAILFTAWRAGLSLYQILRHRHARPVLSLVKLLSLAAALLSFFALQCTVLARHKWDFAYRLPLNAATGGAVCLALFLTGCFMLRRARRELKKKGM